MTAVDVAALWFRAVPAGNFHNIEREAWKDKGGGGPTYIEIPASLVAGTLQLLGAEPGDIPVTIQAYAVGAPGGGAAPLTFESKTGGRLRIANQNRRITPDLRHPAWRPELGFPEAPTDVAGADQARQYLPGERLVVYIVQDEDGAYHAGFTTGTELPQGWPDHPWLADLFDPGVDGGYYAGLAVDEPTRQVLGAWRRGKAALLYGPPGTGKTRVMSRLRRWVEGGAATALRLDPADREAPFSVVLGGETPIPTPAGTDWLTFHQDLSYDDFVIGLRPAALPGGGFELVPRLGRLLEGLYDLGDPDTDEASLVLCIDEVNRGNAARIFGEFITFLDAEYRDHSPHRLPIPLPALTADESGAAPQVRRRSGTPVQLPDPWYFPQHVYTVATMNSVDRAAIPLDSALARRFVRIALRPDLELLARQLGLDWEEVSSQARKIRAPDGDAWQEGGPALTAVLLLDRLNLSIAERLGPDFELGHGLLWDVGTAREEHRWDALVAAWDGELLPQLLERFLNRPRDLLELLRVDDPPPAGPYAFRPRRLLGAETAPAGMELVDDATLRGHPPDVQRATLRWLAR